MAWEDERTVSNPSGWCDLSRAESRLLDGYDTSGVGVERRAPSSGADLRRCVADLLVDAGFGAPWANGWLDPSWVSFLRGAEAEAIESVVAAALRVSERPGVIVLAPYRPGWPSPSGRVRAVPDAAVALVDPAHPAHDGDILDALNAAEAHLHVDVGAVVLGNPSPATGVTADAAVALAASRWCESRGAHLVADETAAAAVVVRPDDDDVDASPRGASAPSLNPTPTPTKPSWGRAAGYASTTSLWRKARASESGWSPHAVTAFGAAGGIRRGKTSCALITRDDRVRALAGTDPFAQNLQALFGDGGTAAREAFDHHGAILRARRRRARDALARLGVAAGPPNAAAKTIARVDGGVRSMMTRPPAVPVFPSDGGVHVWIDLRAFAGTFEEEATLWDRLAFTHRVLFVPGSLCGCAEPGWFRVGVAGDEDALAEGLDRLELGVRYANDTGCG